MKINRFIVLAAITLLVVGAMGAIATRSFALGSHSPVAQISAQAGACAQDQADGTEVKSATDADTIDLQCGDQSTVDTGAADAVGSAETPAGAEAANESKPSDGPNGPSIQVEQTGQSDGQFGQ